jgi:hypothetical protein
VGDRIPLGARICSVADALDAICSDRPYRRGSSITAAIHEIDQCSGAHFDPGVVAAFHQVTQARLTEVSDRFPDGCDVPPELHEAPEPVNEDLIYASADRVAPAASDAAVASLGFAIRQGQAQEWQGAGAWPGRGGKI